MTLERLQEIFWGDDEEHDNEEHGEFERVENPLHPRRDVCALLLLERLAPVKYKAIGGAYHDEIYFAADPENVAEVATEEELLTLIRCGVLYDEDSGSFKMFV